MNSSTSNTQKRTEILTTDIEIKQSHADDVDYYYKAKLADDVVYIRSGRSQWSQAKKEKILQKSAVAVTLVEDINFNTCDVYELN